MALRTCCGEGDGGGAVRALPVLGGVGPGGEEEVDDIPRAGLGGSGEESELVADLGERGEGAYSWRVIVVR